MDSDTAAGSAEGRRRAWVRPVLIGLALALVLALLIFGLLVQGVDESLDQALSEGRPAAAPSFALPLLDPGALPSRLERRVGNAFADGELDLRELRGTPVVLNFWASWCGPCREEAPVLEDGWRRHGPRGVLYLGLDMQDLSDDALAFVEEFEIGYPTIRDSGRQVADEYGLFGIPETYFIDRRGRVVAHAIGVVSAELLDRAVSAARSGEVIGVLSGGAIRPQQ